MIAIDTNVIVRLLTKDDAILQSVKFAENEAGIISKFKHYS